MKFHCSDNIITKLQKLSLFQHWFSFVHSSPFSKPSQSQFNEAVKYQFVYVISKHEQVLACSCFLTSQRRFPFLLQMDVKRQEEGVLHTT